jgi:hypothetical protein
MPPENDNADWGRTAEMAACERWQLEHVAGEVAAPGWYDVLTTRRLSEVADCRVRAFGSVESHTPVEVKAARYRVREGGSRRRGRWWLRESSHRALVDADGEYALAVYDPAPEPDGGVLALTLRPAWWVGARVTSWSPCGPGHRADRAACVPWSCAFDPVDVR